MGNQGRSTRRFCCFRASRDGQPLVTEPVARRASVQQGEKTELTLPLDHALNALGYQGKGVGSLPSTSREQAEEQKEETQVVLMEDIYDPFLMNLSPKVSIKSQQSRKDERTSSLQNDETTADASTVASAKEEPEDPGFFTYGVTLLKEGQKKPVKKPTPPPAAAEVKEEKPPAPISRQASYENYPTSFREGEIASHRIPDDWSNLNGRVYKALVQYFTGSGVPANQQIDKKWSENVKVLMNNKSAKIVNAFRAAYDGKLDFQTSFLICQPLFTAQKGMRIDLILRARVTSWSLHMKNSLKYTYKYVDHSKGNESGRRGGPTYANKYVFECLKKFAKRKVSFTRDISSVHGDDLHVAGAGSISQVGEGDFIEIPVVLMNALGNTDIDSVKFHQIHRDPSDGDSESSLDKQHREWYTVAPNSKYLRQMFPEDINAYSLVQPEKMQPQLHHEATQVAGIDVITSRSLFVAAAAGPIPEARNLIGHTMEVVGAKEPITSESGRCPFLNDNVNLQGDHIQFYTTKG
ncbi:hypothetical protein BgAZ_204430 [Babesia gibsoni]|uniref:Uncharacterized protein n=1 Tax=Babesia gibsoni TaxID=33632 RepID=A0AAD8PE85_BABGI|nr:hypothetical protein BgAZ_204430 [Babesia gibsoni]